MYSILVDVLDKHFAGRDGMVSALEIFPENAEDSGVEVSAAYTSAHWAMRRGEGEHDKSKDNENEFAEEPAGGLGI